MYVGYHRAGRYNNLPLQLTTRHKIPSQDINFSTKKLDDFTEQQIPVSGLEHSPVP